MLMCDIFSATCDNPLAIGGEGHCVNGPGVPFYCEYLLARVRLPHSGCMIKTAGDDPLSIRRKSHGSNKFGMSPEHEQFATAARVQNSSRLIVAPEHNALAVRRKGHRINVRYGVRIGRKFLPGGRFPYLNGSTITAGDNPTTVG